MNTAELIIKGFLKLVFAIVAYRSSPIFYRNSYDTIFIAKQFLNYNGTSTVIIDPGLNYTESTVIIGSSFN